MQDLDWSTVDWANLTAGGLAIALLLGGMLMMFTTVWTTKKR
jgi:hypothetical protein